MNEPDWNRTLDRISPEQWEIYKAIDAIEGIGSKRLDKLFARQTAILLWAKGEKDFDEEAFLFDVATMEKRLRPQKPVESPTRKSTEDALMKLAQQRAGY